MFLDQLPPLRYPAQEDSKGIRSEFLGLEALLQQPGVALSRLRRLGRGQNNLPPNDPGDHVPGEQRAAGVRALTLGQNLPHSDPCGEDVRPERERVRSEGLGRHPCPRQALPWQALVLAGGGPHGESEVGDADVPVLRDQEVPAGDVPVDHLVEVEVREAEEHPAGDPPEPLLLGEVELLVQVVQAPEIAVLREEALDARLRHHYPDELQDVPLPGHIDEPHHLLLVLLRGDLVLRHLERDPLSEARPAGGGPQLRLVRVGEVAAPHLPQHLHVLVREDELARLLPLGVGEVVIDPPVCIRTGWCMQGR
mmetsp:Transcript_31249/g.76239  ORF Transcript_31249/g.76239 Transcript_31249/m.76239 type:complete len:309 (-) Transcript_31249:100-1026(-)